jgi:hypothetical protein
VDRRKLFHVFKGRSVLQSYVIRVYRRSDDNPQHLVGIVEIVQDGRQQRFSSMQELWEILMARDAKVARAGRTREPRD